MAGGVAPGAGRGRALCWSIAGFRWRGAPSVQRRAVAGGVGLRPGPGSVLSQLLSARCLRCCGWQWLADCVRACCERCGVWLSGAVACFRCGLLACGDISCGMPLSRFWLFPSLGLICRRSALHPEPRLQQLTGELAGAGGSAFMVPPWHKWLRWNLGFLSALGHKWLAIHPESLSGVWA